MLNSCWVLRVKPSEEEEREFLITNLFLSSAQLLAVFKFALGFLRVKPSEEEEREFLITNLVLS